MCSRHRNERKGIYTCSMCITQSKKRALRWGYVLNILTGVALMGISRWPDWEFCAPLGLALVGLSLAVVIVARWFRGYEQTVLPLKFLYWICLAPSFLVLSCVILPIVVIFKSISDYEHSTSAEGVREYWVGVVRDGMEEADRSERMR
ncbi:MAG: hypothetical protein ABSB75_03360 [Candidatus Limnocylindrales bacterium]